MFHNRQGLGSTFIRVHQLLKYWPEAQLYKYGENPDVLILQKVYCTPEYKFPAHFKGKKILDMCDPDWLNGLTLVKETIDCVDAVTVPTEALAEFIRQLTDKPVVVIPDRFDMKNLPKPKKHTGKAKTVVWFGYRHNSELLRPALRVIDEMGLDLIVIADDEPFLYQWSKRKQGDWYQYVKYDESTFYETLKKADYCLLPRGMRPQDHFKSNNKSVKAKLAGLPVAYTAEDMQKFADPEARQKAISSEYAKIVEEYDVRKSVKEMKELIESL